MTESKDRDNCGNSSVQVLDYITNTALNQFEPELAKMNCVHTYLQNAQHHPPPNSYPTVLL